MGKHQTRRLGGASRAESTSAPAPAQASQDANSVSAVGAAAVDNEVRKLLQGNEKLAAALAALAAEMRDVFQRFFAFEGRSQGATSVFAGTGAGSARTRSGTSSSSTASSSSSTVLSQTPSDARLRRSHSGRRMSAMLSGGDAAARRRVSATLSLG